MRDFIVKYYTLMNPQMCILILWNMNAPADVPKSTFAGSFKGKKSSRLLYYNILYCSILYCTILYCIIHHPLCSIQMSESLTLLMIGTNELTPGITVLIRQSQTFSLRQQTLDTLSDVPRVTGLPSHSGPGLEVIVYRV